MRVLRPIQAALLSGEGLYREVVLRRMAQARESLWIATANVKAMFVEDGSGGFRSVLELFARLARRGVELRLLHAELPSRPFRAAFEQQRSLWTAMQLKICPRVHFKAVLVDGASASTSSTPTSADSHATPRATPRRTPHHAARHITKKPD